MNYPMGEHVTGTLIYGGDGSVAVHLTQPNRGSFASADPLGGSEAEKAKAFGTTFFYFGTATVLPGRVLHRIETCSFPNWGGTVQERYAELKDGSLLLSTAEVDVGGRRGRLVLEWTPKR